MATELHPGLLATTHDHFVRGKFVDVSMDTELYVFGPAIKRNAERSMGQRRDGSRYVMNFGLPVEVQAWGGTQLTFNAQVAHGDNAQWVTAADPLNVDRRDYQIQLSIPFRMHRCHYSIDEEELSDCRGPEEIVNLRISRELGMDQDFVQSFESWGWGAPPPSTDVRTAFPLRYWLYSEPESTSGSYATFNVLVNNGKGNFMKFNHASYTNGPGGQSRVTYPQLGNWNVQYTAFTNDDYVKKFTVGALRIGFRTPVSFPRLDKEMPMQAAYTTTDNVIEKATLSRQMNDTNTSDLQARFYDLELFNIPHVAVPHLDDEDKFTLYGADNKDVVYLIDWSTWSWTTKEGFDLKVKTFKDQMQAPLTETKAQFLRGNLVCWNPRRNAVLSK